MLLCKVVKIQAYTKVSLASYSVKRKLRIVAILVATDPITVVSFQVYLSR